MFEARLNGSTIRINIGTLTDWPIKQARTKAQGLKMLVDAGTDPREVARDRLAAKAALKAAASAQAVTVGDVWPRYLIEGKPKRKEAFKPRYRADLEAMAAPGGEKKKRGGGQHPTGAVIPAAGAGTVPSERGRTEKLV